jgi:hypothetical protein
MVRIIDMILGEKKREPRKKTYKNIIEVVIVYTRDEKTQVLLRDTNDNDIDLGHVEFWEVEDMSKVKRIYGGDDFVTSEPGMTMIEAREEAPFTVEYDSQATVEVPERPYVLTVSKITIK